MRIAEIYPSIQGEGLLTGTPSVFVRASGCNLRCWFCDTTYASWQPEGRDYSVDEIVEEVASSDCTHIVLTGGEPMLFAETIPLTERLRDRGRHVTIETAGTLYLPVACDLMSLSPKLRGSGPAPDREVGWSLRHERQRYQPNVLRRLMAEFDYQLKFVVDRPEEIDEIVAFLADFPEATANRVLLMPQCRTTDEQQTRASWLKSICGELGWTYCPRKQLEWFGPLRGT